MATSSDAPLRVGRHPSSSRIATVVSYVRRKKWAVIKVVWAAPKNGLTSIRERRIRACARCTPVTHRSHVCGVHGFEASSGLTLDRHGLRFLSRFALARYDVE